jgi:hypothetical protein
MRALLLISLMGAAAASTASAGAWSKPAEVRQDTTLCVTYRARFAGEYLVVEARHEPGWHTNSMDNDKRAAEKLAGKKALGVDKPTTITAEGIDIAGPWHQTPPKDFSKPDLLWYTWGFDTQAQFVAKVKAPKAGQITIRGQACSEASCKNIELTLAVPGGAGKEPPPDLKSLIAVR